MSDSIFENQRGKAADTADSISRRQQNELATLAESIRKNHNLLKENLDRLQRSLDNLRLITKYRIFDLEATRRENTQLRRLLDERSDQTPSKE